MQNPQIVQFFYSGDESYWEYLLTQKPDQSAFSVINHDLSRTYPQHSMFNRRNSTADSKDGQPRLYRLLCAYACHDPDVGYCQGIFFESRANSPFFVYV